ncbi:exodeoxyribonuclease-3 [Amycolatopsis arida]|uniref:Exodeoxyribonuclease-3 n=1 Tax=Amycolatopsis arida TaxID=587909 RepID=A0A1I5WUM5_9PSEU|nr:exodeoxyribonuclease III [Amycolatopsis arida]TDX92463.1 exodeoxyribonuclease-3 [Amycolatopsis arida]SFQ23495.1 exodeoxyribonuclease-3 [Amycolatopsis arida]
MLTVSTVNVNGLRAAAKKGFVEWLGATDAQVVACQEVRCAPEQLPALLREPAGWHTAHAVCATKGRNGVCLFSRTEPESVRVGFGEAEFEDSGRYVEMHLPGLVVASVYLPSGDVGTSRQEEKERFMAAFLPYLVELRGKAEASGREVLVLGDWNIAHAEVDLKNWRGNRNNSGFLPEEREWLGRVFGEAGYVDVQRRLDPHGPGPYTWWSYRGKAFDNDAGWRIDYHVATPGLADRVVEMRVERAPSYDQRWSDHAPVTATFDWPPP